MTAPVDIANRALSAMGGRDQIADLNEDSPEARSCRLLMFKLRDELLRLAPWNCATVFNNLALICAAPGTPENPTGTPTLVWERGQPYPPWLYEYGYPADCLRPIWIVPAFTTGYPGPIPIFPFTTSTAPFLWTGPPIRYKVAVDQIADGVPTDGGSDTKVILTNQSQATLSYIKRVDNPDVWDDQFCQALVSALSARLALPLSGDKDIAKLNLAEANSYIQIARAGDGNEGLTVNDVTPDFIRVRGVGGGPYFNWYSSFEWGPLLAAYG